MWYKILWYALHEKRTHEGQLRSITDNGGQTKSRIVLLVLDK
jgi:hypothetical protein